MAGHPNSSKISEGITGSTQVLCPLTEVLVHKDAGYMHEYTGRSTYLAQSGKADRCKKNSHGDVEACSWDHGIIRS